MNASYFGKTDIGRVRRNNEDNLIVQQIWDDRHLLMVVIDGVGGYEGGEVAAAWLTFVETCKLQKKAALEVFKGYFQRIVQGRRDYDLITEEVLC